MTTWLLPSASSSGSVLRVQTYSICRKLMHEGWRLLGNRSPGYWAGREGFRQPSRFVAQRCVNRSLVSRRLSWSPADALQSSADARTAEASRSVGFADRGGPERCQGHTCSSRSKKQWSALVDL